MDVLGLGDLAPAGRRRDVPEQEVPRHQDRKALVLATRLLARRLPACRQRGAQHGALALDRSQIGRERVRRDARVGKRHERRRDLPVDRQRHERGLAHEADARRVPLPQQPLHGAQQLERVGGVVIAGEEHALHAALDVRRRPLAELRVDLREALRPPLLEHVPADQQRVDAPFLRVGDELTEPRQLVGQAVHASQPVSEVPVCGVEDAQAQLRRSLQRSGTSDTVST